MMSLDRAKATVQPAWGQMALKATNVPATGWRTSPGAPLAGSVNWAAPPTGGSEGGPRRCPAGLGAVVVGGSVVVGAPGVVGVVVDGGTVVGVVGEDGEIVPVPSDAAAALVPPARRPNHATRPPVARTRRATSPVVAPRASTARRSMTSPPAAGRTRPR